MKIISFNVNGIRAAISRGLYEWLETENPDIFCVQETKAQPEQFDYIKFQELGYDCCINSAEKKGYSGTAVFTKIKPVSVAYNFDNKFVQYIFTDSFGNILKEGRVVTLELENFYLVNTYVPNVKNELERLAIRHDIWDKKILEYIAVLEKKKPIIWCGDLNVAHKAIDLANPKNNEKNAGFTKEEREGFDNFMNYGLIDVFRHFYPGTVKYTWWSMRMKARERNVGWRIDYFLCSKKFIQNIKFIDLMNDVVMSDHCPIKLILKN